MKEPVLVAVIGVGGVLVGAASSGLVQALLARAKRKRDGRNAARVLSMELHDAGKAVSDLRELRDWTQMITGWDTPPSTLRVATDIAGAAASSRAWTEAGRAREVRTGSRGKR